MKNRLLALLFVLGIYAAHSQVGIATKNPNPSAALEIFSNNKGLLIPQIALTSIVDTETIIPGNVVGLLVYNTTNNTYITPGYYYWFDNKWNRILVSADLNVVAGSSVPAIRGEAGYSGENITLYTDKTTGDVYVQKQDGTWKAVTGIKGDKGDTGEQGIQGVTGAKGDKGDKGDTGAQGIKGIPGVQGVPGIDGPKGEKGDKGDTGNTGAQGIQGVQGVQGVQGAAGIGGKTIGGVGITVTGSGSELQPYIVNAALPSQEISDQFSPFDGQLEFTLIAVPATISKVKMYINGLRINNNAVSVTGRVVTYTPDFNNFYELKDTDNVIIDYLK